MWKTLSEFPLYEINEYGVVRNSETHYVITQRMDRSGYLFVQLYNGKINYCRLVHRLVAEAFIRNPDNLPIVNHIDECCVHNAADNLEWISYKGNSNHGTRNERIVRERKIHVIAFDESGNTLYRFESRYDASRELSVSENSIRTAMKNRNKCKKLYWRAASLSPDEDETKKNIEWIKETEKIKKVNQLQRKPPTKRTVSAIDERGEKVYSFPSMTKAAKVMQVSSPAISSAVKNKTKCKGFRWIIDEEKGYDL